MTGFAGIARKKVAPQYLGQHVSTETWYHHSSWDTRMSCLKWSRFRIEGNCPPILWLWKTEIRLQVVAKVCLYGHKSKDPRDTLVVPYCPRFPKHCFVSEAVWPAAANGRASFDCDWDTWNVYTVQLREEANWHSRTKAFAVINSK